MSVKLNTESCEQAFDSLSGELVGVDQAWLSQRRHDALNRLGNTGFPTVKHEDWKYTDIRLLTKHEYVLDASIDLTAMAAKVESSRIDALDALRIVIVNGRFRRDLSTIDSLPEGLIAGGLAEQIASDPASVKAWIGQALPENGHGFSSLNDAFVNDGVYINVSAGITVSRPVEIVYMISAGDVAPLAQPRTLVIVAEGASIEVVERYISDSEDTYLTNAVSEVFVGSGARIELDRIQEEGSRAGHVGGLFVCQRTDSHAVINTISLDGMLIRNDLRASLDEPGAKVVLNGLALGDGRQHIDNHTHVDHIAEHCISREFYKSVLDDRSRAVFHGRIVVHKDAQKTDSEQQNKSLLLSRNAEVDTKPQLEIYADDVKCSHGATVGQLDETAVYYLRTRGIDEQSARGILTFAFADSAITDISNEALRAYIDTRIRDKLGAGDLTKGMSF